MRVLIMSDMEGVSGIVVWEQVNGGAPMYEEGRKLYTEEINAAVRGARAGGATEIVVVDCHGAGGLGAADGGVDLLSVEAAAFLVERCAAVDLIPDDDAGDAFHVGHDEDAHGVGV